jgi:hypothetical protein
MCATSVHQCRSILHYLSVHRLFYCSSTMNVLLSMCTHTLQTVSIRYTAIAFIVVPYIVTLILASVSQ